MEGKPGSPEYEKHFQNENTVETTKGEVMRLPREGVVPEIHPELEQHVHQTDRQTDHPADRQAGRQAGPITARDRRKDHRTWQKNRFPRSSRPNSPVKREKKKT